MSDQNLRSIICDFTNDLTKVFPEYAFLWEKWLTADDAEYDKLNQHFLAIFPERFFDIMNSNMEIFSAESEVNVMFLPDVDFKILFNCAGVSEGTKTSMWKYLQLLLFTVLGSVKDTANFGETLNMFESLDENDLQDKMKETMEGLGNFFTETNTDSKGFKLPKPEVLQEHMKVLMEGKLGKLAKELTEEFTNDLKDVFDDDTDDKSIKDIMAKFAKDPKKIMAIMKKITDKLQTKLKNGEISQDELMKEVSSLVEKFKEMGGGEDFMKNFTNGPFAKMFKNMAAGAGLNPNSVVQMGKQSAMKERLRKKMEERKMREAVQALSASQQVSQQVSQQATQASHKQVVVKIGDEIQEKSGLRPPTNAVPTNAVPTNALSEEELVNLFKKKKKAKK